MFGSRGRGSVVTVVVVTVQQRRGAHGWFGLTDQRHLGAEGVTAKEVGR